MRALVRPGRRSGRGFTLVELMVAVAIGLVVMLIVFRVLVDSESRKRTSTSTNDANQSGAYAAYVLDRALRSAGTGYSQAWGRVGGCRLNAQLPPATGEAWPRVNALPAPFGAIPQTVRLAPAVIFDDASDTGSDVLMVMSGATGFGEAPTFVQPGSVTATQVQLPNTIGFRANDLVLLAGANECLLTQVSAAKAPCAGDPAAPTAACTPTLPFAGDYYTAAGAFTSMAALGAVADLSAFAIGNPATNPPQMQLFGVGDDSTLMAHDMLLMQNGPNESQPLAEGVRQMHAVYGVDTDNNGTLNAWVTPDGAWSAANLLDGTPAAATRLRQIVALRVGLVMRSQLIERELDPGVPVAPANLTLFADLPTPVVVDLTVAGENRNQRHRTVEVTVPLRNSLLR